MNKYYCGVDGALKGNRLEAIQNPDCLRGGGSCIICNENYEIIDILYSGYLATTSNRMEVRAVLEGLKYFNKPSNITFVTDSQYVVYALNSNGIKIIDDTSDKANKDLGIQIKDFLNFHNVSVKGTKGHANDKFNQIADFGAQFGANCLNLPKDEYTDNSKKSGESLVSKSNSGGPNGSNSRSKDGEITYSLG